MDTLKGNSIKSTEVCAELTDFSTAEPFELTAATLRNMPVILFRLDENGAFVECCGAGLKRLGLAEHELVGRLAVAEFPQMEVPLQHALGGENVRFACNGTCDEQPWTLDVFLSFDDVRGSGATGFAIDVSDRDEAVRCVEEHRMALAHIDRVTTVEQMASGIAHELNQPLAVVVARAEVAARKLESGQELDRNGLIDSFERIADEAYRAGCIIQRMKDFTKKAQPHRGNISMAAVLDEVVGLVESDLRHESIDLICDVAPDLPSVVADRIQIQQVLLNLIRNAMDAIVSSEGEVKQIAVRSCVHKGALLTTVSDTGCGFSDEEAARFFETFYTTKREGMGMGLAISRSIVEAHGGHIEAGNNANRGAYFAFTIPISMENSQ